MTNSRLCGILTNVLPNVPFAMVRNLLYLQGGSAALPPCEPSKMNKSVRTLTWVAYKLAQMAEHKPVKLMVMGSSPMYVTHAFRTCMNRLISTLLARCDYDNFGFLIQCPITVSIHSNMILPTSAPLSALCCPVYACVKKAVKIYQIS